MGESAYVCVPAFECKYANTCYADTHICTATGGHMLARCGDKRICELSITDCIISQVGANLRFGYYYLQTSCSFCFWFVDVFVSRVFCFVVVFAALALELLSRFCNLM